MSRSKRRLIAKETLDIISNGGYQNRHGENVSIENEMALAVAGTTLIRPADFDVLADIVSRKVRDENPTIEVLNETTFAGARDILNDGANEVCSLNFASANQPGGGFLTGSQAQEEALARASGLFPCLQQAVEYYSVHRNGVNSLYTHHMIYSPKVPVFRDDNDELLDSAWQTSIITSPAVNAGAVEKNTPNLAVRILPTMKERIDRVLVLAAARGHKHLVLGAWGCGVFRNNPTAIAALFADSIATGPASNAFKRIRFSVLDHENNSPTFNAFRQKLTR